MAIAKKGYITVDSLVNEALTDLEYTSRIDEELPMRWAHNRSEEIMGTEQLVYSVALVDIKEFKGKLPEGLHSIYVAAIVGDNTRRWNKEMLIGYTKHLPGTDCDVEVNLLCPKHGTSDCGCQHGVMDVQVDDLYLMSKPYLWAMTSAHYIGYSAATTDGFPVDSGFKKPVLMVPRPTNAALWNSEYYLGMCASLGSPNAYTYEIEPPYFITDLREGQVMLSFLRYPKDERGYNLIPNYPSVVKAIVAYITEKLMWREWMKSGNQNDRLRWLDAQRLSDMYKNEATSEMEMPDPDRWTRDMKQIWILENNRFHYGGR